MNKNLLKAIGLVALGSAWVFGWTFGFEQMWGTDYDTNGYGALGAVFSLVTVIGTAALNNYLNWADEERKKELAKRR
jgi:hypothetical protein